MIETWSTCAIRLHYYASMCEMRQPHHCPLRPPSHGADTANLSQLLCHLSRFPHAGAKLGIWPSVFFKTCDPDVEIKDEFCYWIKQIQEVLTTSAPNTLKLQTGDLRANGEYILWEGGRTQRALLSCALDRCEKTSHTGWHAKHCSVVSWLSIASYYWICCRPGVQVIQTVFYL